MKYIFIVCIIVGILEGLKQMSLVHKNIKPGIQESSNLFTFLFTDKY